MTFDELFRNQNHLILDDFCIEQIIDSIVNTGETNTRGVLPPDYKEPAQSRVVSQDEYLDYQTSVVEAIIEKIKKDIKTYGYEKEREFINESESDFAQILTLSHDQIYNALKYESIRYLKYLKENFAEFITDHNGGEVKKIYRCNYSGGLGRGYEARIYLNTCNSPYGSTEDTLKFLSIYIKKCIEREIPFQMKGDRGGSGKGQLDTTVFYTSNKYLTQNMEVLDEIAREYPELVEKFGSPVVSGVRNNYYTVSTGGVLVNCTNQGPSDHYDIGEQVSSLAYGGTINDHLDKVCLRAFIRSCGQYILDLSKLSNSFKVEVQAILGENYEEELRQMANSDDNFSKYTKYNDTTKTNIKNLSQIVKKMSSSQRRNLLNRVKKELPKSYRRIKIKDGLKKSDLIQSGKAKLNFSSDLDNDLPIGLDNFMYEAMLAERSQAIGVIKGLRSRGIMKKIVQEIYPKTDLAHISLERLASVYISAVGLEEFTKAFEITQRLNEDNEKRGEHIQEKNPITGKVYTDYELPDYALEAFSKKLSNAGKTKEEEEFFDKERE